MWFAAYQVVRVVKWLLWTGFMGYSLFFMSDRTPHLTSFGHLTLNAELFMLGLPFLSKRLKAGESSGWPLVAGAPEARSTPT